MGYHDNGESLVATIMDTVLIYKTAFHWLVLFGSEYVLAASEYVYGFFASVMSRKYQCCIFWQHR